MMEGEKSLPKFSPEYMVLTPAFRRAVPLLPPITLYHGTADYSIPHVSRYFNCFPIYVRFYAFAACHLI